jgi:fumarylacetoacetate (FAA) hydrolase
MRLATLRNGTPDGQLIKISADGTTYADASMIAPTLQAALEHWDAIAPRLEALPAGIQPLQPAELMAPLPRAWQWLDGSAYPSHGALMDQILGVKPEKTGRPLMYQGMSDRFLSGTEPVRFPSEDLGIDFEGEFGVIVDHVPMGTTVAEAGRHIKLIVQINDWSLRTLAAPEMKTGFGWVQAKPACSAAPFAVTPDALGADWRGTRVCLFLEVDWNGRRFGRAYGEPMEFGFDELIAHAARTRDLVAGTIIGSGTVSNANFREIGSSCIAERRGIERVDTGTVVTEFMRFGDRVRMCAVSDDGVAPFGVIDQCVVPA